MNTKGFTLIELIIALAIVMIMVTIMGTTLVRVLETHQRISAERVLVEEVQDFVNYFTFLVRLGDASTAQWSDRALQFRTHTMQQQGPYTIEPQVTTWRDKEVNTLIKKTSSGTEPLLGPGVTLKDYKWWYSTRSDLHPMLHYRFTFGSADHPSIELTVQSTITLRN